MSKSKKGCPLIGFVSDKGLMLDLDNISRKGVENLAEAYLKRYKLEGYLLIQSSEKNYHLVFNRYLTWKKILGIVFKTTKAISWGIWQAKKEELTLRVSPKNGKKQPKIIKTVGKQDKLIADYLYFYKKIPTLLKELS